MNKQTIVWVIILVSFFGSPVFSQTNCGFTIRGKVLHDENNEPIENAYVWIDELAEGAISDEKGNFRVDSLCEGKYSVKVNYIGHLEERKVLKVDKNVNVTFRMKGADIVLEGVEIHGHRDAVITTNSVSSLSGEALDEVRGESLGNMLRKIAGVSTFSTGASISKPVIHGMHSNRILILNNGIRQEGQQWGSDHAPEIDPFMAEEIAVVKGAETVRYGPEAMGGVVVVNPPELPVSNVQQGELHLIGNSNGGSGSAALSFEGGSDKIKGLGYRLQSSGKYGGNIRSPGYFQQNTGIQEINVSGAVGYSSSKSGIELFFSRYESTLGLLADAHTGNLSDLQAIIENGRPFSVSDFTYQVVNPKQKVKHTLFKAKAHHHLKNGAQLNLQYGFQQNNRQEFDKRRGGRHDQAALDLELFTNTLELNFEHKKRKHWNGSIGLNLIQQTNNNIPGTGVTPLIPNYDMYNLGIFAIEKFTRGHLELEGGLRYDYRYVDAARYNQEQEFEERSYSFQNMTAFLGGIYSFSPNLTLNTSVGSAWRPPNINEQFSQGLHHGSAAYEYGNPDFESEQAVKWLITLSYSSKRLNLELTGYVHRINNYIFLNPTGEHFVSLRGTFNVFRYEQTRAGFWGTDLSARFAVLPNLDWYARGAMVRAKDLEKNNYLPNIPADRIETGLTYKLKNVGSLRENRLTVNTLLVSRQDREPDFDFAPAPKGYNLWDLNVSTRIPFNTQPLHTSLGVNNIFNISYKEYLNRFRYFSHEMGRNISLKIRYEF